MLQERKNTVFHEFKYVFHMKNKGQIHNGMISKETQSNIILSNALPLSLRSLIRHSFKKFKSEYVKQDLLAPYTGGGT